MRIAFGLSMDGSTQPPRVDGLELTDLEWQVWLDAYRNGWVPFGADEQVRKFRNHFAVEREITDDETA